MDSLRCGRLYTPTCDLTSRAEINDGEHLVGDGYTDMVRVGAAKLVPDSGGESW